MDLAKSLEEIGKFFNEVLGYLLPGLLLLFLIYFFLDPTEICKYDLFLEINAWFILFSGYIMGYVVYGISHVFNTIFKTCYYFKLDEKIIILNICKIDEYKRAKDKIVELIPNLNLEKLDFHSIRNYSMAYVPEVDQKIYTFMFRADLFKHMKDTFLIVSIWGILAYLSKLFFNNTILFDVSGYNILLVLLLLLLTYPLNEGKKRFLTIAYKIQFNIFLAKAYPIKNENK
jgi:hypothetical protein